METETLAGAVERITFYNTENGFSVLRLLPEPKRLVGVGRDGLATVTGNLPELAPGEHVRLRGRWVNHPKHGMQFEVEFCEQTLPASVDGIRRYLGSGLIRGIGPRLAERIVAHFGAQTLEIIETQPERMLEVDDIGRKRSALIALAWEEQKHVKEIMLFLHGHGVSTNLAVKIYKEYGDQALAVVRSDPYRLARDIYGVGFKTADQIARKLGLPVDHPSRVEAGLVYVLNEMSNEGHVYAPRQDLITRAGELLGLPEDNIEPGIERLAADGRAKVEAVPLPAWQAAKVIKVPGVGEKAGFYSSQAVYLAPFYFGELGVAEKLRTLATMLLTRLSDVPPAFMALDPTLSVEQQAAVRTALGHPVSVLTGGPGTGKTTAMRALIAALESAGKKYALASPTGRAAKRLAEATGRPASTIHRLLGPSPTEGFKYNASNPLPIDFLVVDEASMLDLLLTYALVKALAPGTHVLLVGDVDQLPSVGAGDVLRDLIASGVVPVTRLGQIFRQAADSQIITNAHRINHGEMPLLPVDGRDFFLFQAATPEEAGDWVQDVVVNRIPARFGLQAREDIQVLAPMYRGPAGVTALNLRLQAALNPPDARRPEKLLFGQLLRLGDKVMQTVNNYEKETFNGDIGWISGLDLIAHSLEVTLDGRRVSYDWSEADQLVLAYAVSVHKAQGSEFPAVVVPLVTAHYMMLQRNLLYTAVTRAKRLCVLVGSRKALGIAIGNNKVTHRFTALDWRLGKN